MKDVEPILSLALKIPGAVGAALVSYHTGTCYGVAGDNPSALRLSAAGNADVVRAKLAILKDMGKGDTLEDIQITTSTAVHLIHVLPTPRNLFLYLIADRARADLWVARRELRTLAMQLTARTSAPDERPVAQR